MTLDLEALTPPEEPEADTEADTPSAPAADASAEPEPAPLPDRLIVPFNATGSELSEDARASLVALAGLLKKSRLRVTIVSYASVAEERSENAAQRLALERAINLRHLLVAEGIDGTRINLKPEGRSSAQDGPADRAEIIIEDAQ